MGDHHNKGGGAVDGATKNDLVLGKLRSSIDALDAEVLRLLAQRMHVVEQIAAHKRQHGLRIRDLQRERQVLVERGQQAENLGLPAVVIESVFRLLLLASRNLQASLRVEVPANMVPRRVAVIGGKGGMGACMVSMFRDLGHQVDVVDRDTELLAVDAARQADVVVVSVPIGVTEEVIRSVGPHLRRDALLMDVTSIKAAPLAAMLASTNASVLGTHPMFGPGVHTLAGQRIVLCRGRGDAWHDWAVQVFGARGLVVTEATAEEHDALMVIVQVLTHFQKQVLGLTLSRFGVPFQRSLAFTSPAYLLETYVAARHFAQSPDLYGPIEMLNPRTGELVDTFLKAANDLADILRRGDQAAFAAVFAQGRQFFGRFSDEALQQSTFLIDRMVELTAGKSSDDFRSDP